MICQQIALAFCESLCYNERGQNQRLLWLRMRTFAIYRRSGAMNRIIDQVYRVAIYLRRSKDDGDFSVSGSGKTESNSIHNQRELLMNYLAGHPEMELVGEYKDDG